MANKQKQRKKKQPKTGNVAIDSPVPNRPYLMPTDELCVSGTSNADAVRLLVLFENDAADPDNPNAVEVVPVNQQFSTTVAYCGAIASPPEEGNYKVVAYPMTAGTAGAPVTVPYSRRAESGSRTVSANCSPWYALAASGALGPYAEEDPVGPFAPVPVRIPFNAESVEFNANPSDRWRHFTGPESEADADGKPEVITDLENPAYQSAALGSDVIGTLNTNVCKLIGVWKIDGTNYAQFEIGLSSSHSIPLDATLDGTLYLAMHDGKRWFNNGGSVDVSYQWTVAPCSSVGARSVKRKKTKSTASKGDKQKK